jgi:hypothetical protein
MGRGAHLELMNGEGRRKDGLDQVSAVLEDSADALFATTMCLMSAEALANDPEVEARIVAAIETLDETITTVRKAVLQLSGLETTNRQPR